MSKAYYGAQYNYLSCFKCDGCDNKCGPFLSSEEAQKVYNKYMIGWVKEMRSIYQLS